MKIDLHTHTKKTKEGDSKNRNIGALDFIEKMQQNNIAICAITNHNHFDLQQFNEIENEEPEFLLLPGIELDIDHEEGHYHFIIICNPSRAKEFKKTFDNDNDRNYNTYNLPYRDLIRKVKEFDVEDVIVFPHFGNKDKKRAIDTDTKNQLKTDLEGYLVILEPGKLHTMGIINAHEELSLVGSDVHDWSTYSSDYLPEIKFKINKFEDFIQLANHTPMFIRNYLNGTDSYNLEVKNGSTNIGGIELYRDINILFGEKGSGKTYLLEEYIQPYFQDLGLNLVHHAGKYYMDNYNELINSFKDKVTIDHEKFESASNDLESIFKYSERKPDNIISQLFKYHKNQTNNKKVQKINKFTSKYNKSPSTDAESIKAEISDNIKKLDDAYSINISLEDYRDKQNFCAFNKELQILKKDMIEKRMEDFKEVFRVERTEKFLHELKNSINRQTGTTSRPNTIGFSSLVNQRLRRLQKNERIKNTLNDLNKREEFLLGELPMKGKVKLSVRYQVLTPEDKAYNSPFRQNTIKNNRDIIEKINDFNISNFKNINKYFEGLIDGINTQDFMNDVIKKTHSMSVGDNINYNPSEGEKAILTVTALLEDNSYDVYLFDELERGLGQKYLSDYVIPKLKRLRDNGKIIIVSTHNSNLAVNTLPSQTIYCDFSPESNEIYYVGNMYANELKCTYSDKIVKWNHTALVHLEGTKTMFKVRRNTFGIN
ncbi:hypothetical protein [Alkalibacillus salilacus]|uniref:ATPase n=1 Tax=Alkalibacillus salilacus TaxID=284582 RepID=A0ABT9VJ30_9BACI|nr:hypothetical protein [Alkalibacillus salilacus]MDQ0160877.1 putative ATPase [Alkalibacillus salilacus]